MKIGLGQIDMGFEERERAMELCRAILAEAGEQGVDLTVFPETALTGFTLRPKTYGEQRHGSASIAFFREEARKNNTAVCFGMPVHENGVSTNTVSCFPKQGNCWQTMRKYIPFPMAQKRNIIRAAMKSVSVNWRACRMRRLSAMTCGFLKFSRLLRGKAG